MLKQSQHTQEFINLAALAFFRIFFPGSRRRQARTLPDLCRWTVGLTLAKSPSPSFFTRPSWTFTAQLTPRLLPSFAIQLGGSPPPLAPDLNVTCAVSVQKQAFCVGVCVTIMQANATCKVCLAGGALARCVIEVCFYSDISASKPHVVSMLPAKFARKVARWLHGSCKDLADFLQGSCIHNVTESYFNYLYLYKCKLSQ